MTQDMRDPWTEESDPWQQQAPKTQPTSFTPPAPGVNYGNGFPAYQQPANSPTLAAKKSKWRDPQSNFYTMTINGDEVFLEGEVLQGGKSTGTLREGVLEIAALPGRHHYSESKITLGGVFAGLAWTRLPDTENGGNLRANAPAWNMPDALNGTQQNGYAQQPTSEWDQQEYAQPQQIYAQPQQEYAQPQQNYAQPQQEYSQPQNYAQPRQEYSQPQPTYDAWNDTPTPANNGTTGYSYDNSQPQQESAAQDAWGTWGATTGAAAPAEPGNAGNAWANYSSSAPTDTADATGSWEGWGAANNDRANESWEEAEKRRFANYWRDFKAVQEWYIQQGNPPGSNMSADPFAGCRQMVGEGADFNLYESVSTKVSGNNADNITKLADFDDLWHRYPGRIPDSLWANMQKCGFKTPTPVQRYAIPIGLEGRDMMCSAQTGSGKTAAFLIPMLASMIKHHKAVGSLEEPFQGACKPDTLILTPTRELCMQTYEDALRFCYNTHHRCYRVYGQQNAKTQLTELAKGADLIVATVGRLYDFVRAGIINLEDVNCLVLDEADRMLDMGFQEQIKEIVESHKMPSKDHRQTMMFSATFPDSVQEMAKDYLHDFLMIVVGSAGSPAVTVTQCVEKVDKAEKEQKLTDFVTEVLKRDPDNRILVFTNSKNSAKFLDEKLYAGTATTAALHGDLDQPKREEHLESFRRGTVDIMIATDVASRGLDISRVTHVVNYDAPKEISLYVHRIGRTGRIGHRGTALTYITYEDSWCMDSDDFLRDLPDVMQGAPNTWVPDWLQELSDSKKGDVWNYKKPEWGTSDVRDRGNEQSGGFQGWGESTQDATNQDWSAWNGMNGNAGANGNSNNWNNNNSWN